MVVFVGVGGEDCIYYFVHFTFVKMQLGTNIINLNRKFCQLQNFAGGDLPHMRMGLGLHHKVSWKLVLSRAHCNGDPLVLKHHQSSALLDTNL